MLQVYWQNLVDYLLKQHRVTAIIHNSSIKHEFSTDLYKEIAGFDSLDSLDISSDVDCIFHLAATGVSPRLASWDHLLDINVRLTLSICQLANKLGCRVICSGTFAEYGLSANNYSHIPPGAPLQPTFPYAASKAAASTLAISYALSEGIELAYLRIFNAFGLGQHESNLWPSLRLAAISGCDFPLSQACRSETLFQSPLLFVKCTLLVYFQLITLSNRWSLILPQVAAPQFRFL